MIGFGIDLDPFLKFLTICAERIKLENLSDKVDVDVHKMSNLVESQKWLVRSTYKNDNNLDIFDFKIDPADFSY